MYGYKTTTRQSLGEIGLLFLKVTHPSEQIHGFSWTLRKKFCYRCFASGGRVFKMIVRILDYFIIVLLSGWKGVEKLTGGFSVF